jgi:hypothetical protein
VVQIENWSSDPIKVLVIFSSLKRGATVSALGTARRDDLAAIEAIARSAFVTGRFNIDPKIGVTRGGERYSRWVRNIFLDPRHTVVKAAIAGEIAGFLITEERGMALATGISLQSLQVFRGKELASPCGDE